MTLEHPTVFVPRFDEDRYLAENRDARAAIETGLVKTSLDHFLRYGIDENRSPQMRRESILLRGALERAFVSQSGRFLILGWLSDEGADPPRCRLYGGEFHVEIPVDAILRHARPDVEAQVREGAYDYGFIVFGQCPSKTLLKQAFLLQLNSMTSSFQARTEPELVSDKRILDTLLTLVATIQSHAGREGGLYAFLSSSAGASMIELFRSNVASCLAGRYVERFRERPIERSFVTVLFGSAEAMLLQPVLFRQQGIDFGEWIYVCNSPEDATTVLRLARLISDLYDVMITVVVMTDNAGFGAANNAAVEHASSDSIYIINPDVYPHALHSDALRKTLEQRDLGTTLWGGLLFYDDDNLMHSGMYLDQDVFFRCHSLNRAAGPASTSSFKLLRVEHFDKGVPFDAGLWGRPKAVPAITGAVMAFRKAPFEMLGGFSTRYIYGHYEDADLSLRWVGAIGAVAIDPGLRLVHFEGQGSRARGEQYRGAAIANRYFFTQQHGGAFEQKRELLTRARDLPAS